MGNTCNEFFETSSPIGDSIVQIRQQGYELSNYEKIDPQTKQILEQLKNKPGTHRSIQAIMSSFPTNSSKNTRKRTNTTWASGKSHAESEKELISFPESSSILGNSTTNLAEMANSPHFSIEQLMRAPSKTGKYAERAHSDTLMITSSSKAAQKTANPLMESSRSTTHRPNKSSSQWNSIIILITKPQ